ncbi:MAG: tauA [Hyphomicrobiales bacterium]|nr:tauA [Hyphomicrobiales bacterium]
MVVTSPTTGGVYLTLRKVQVFTFFALLWTGPAMALDTINMAKSQQRCDPFHRAETGLFSSRRPFGERHDFWFGREKAGYGRARRRDEFWQRRFLQRCCPQDRPKIVASSGSAPPRLGHNMLIIRNALIDCGRYNKPSEIKGLRVSMPSPGPSAAATLNAYLVGIGLGFHDIEPVYLSYPNQVAALASGNIDVGLSAEPQASQAIQPLGLATSGPMFA